MRPLEIALVLGAALAVLAWMLWRSRGVRWNLAIAALPVALGGAHLVFEGARWQMATAYAAVAALLVLLLIQAARFRNLSVVSRGGAVVMGLACALMALGLVAAAALSTLFPVFRLPEPSGPYEIGRVAYHWVDQGRAEPFTDDLADSREVMVNVWYPTQSIRSGTRAVYVQGNLERTAELLDAPSFFLDHLKHIRTHAQPSAPLAAVGSFPVLVYVPGLGSQSGFNTAKIEELVSHGYVVAAIDPPYTTGSVVFPDGRHTSLDPRMVTGNHHKPGTEAYAFFANIVYPVLAEDAIFVLDQLHAVNKADPLGLLTERLDLDRAGMFGGSLGGAATGLTCAREQRFRACLALDARIPAEAVRTGSLQPFMWIGAKPSPSVADFFEALAAEGYLVTIDGMAHPEIGDYPRMIPPPVGVWMGTVGPGDWRQVHDIINAYSVAFFDHYLKGQIAPLLEGDGSFYPRAKLERRPPHGGRP